MYLKDRQSVVLNYNPFMMFSDDPKKPYNDQVGFCSIDNDIRCYIVIYNVCYIGPNAFEHLFDAAETTKVML